MLTIDTLAQEIRRVDGNHSLGAGALAEALMPFISAALSIEQTQPVKVKALEWFEHPGSFPGPTWSAQTPFGFYNIEEISASDSPAYEVRLHAHRLIAVVDGLPEAKAAAQQDCETRIRSALVNAQADADVVERWQPIETAPKDGTPVDLWGVNHLHPRKTGRRATDVTWGRVRDWLGNERDDWQHGQGDDFEPTHWCPVPAAPLSSLRPAEVGSATASKDAGHG